MLCWLCPCCEEKGQKRLFKILRKTPQGIIVGKNLRGGKAIKAQNHPNHRELRTRKFLSVRDIMWVHINKMEDACGL